METLTKRVASVLKTTAFVALATLILVPASADADWKTKWSNGHKIESEDGNFKLKFGGRTQADWSFASADSDLEDAVGPVTDGNEFRRARIFFSGTIYKNIEYKVNYEFSDGGATEIKDLWIKFKPWGIKAGHFHEPFSLEQLTSSKYITFLERSLPDTFAPGRNTGIAYSNSSDSYTFGLGVFRDTDDFGVGTAEDRINITGRFVWRPMYDKDRMLHLGFGFTDKSAEDGDTVRFRQRPEAHLSPRFVNTNSFAYDGLTSYNGELAGRFGPWWFASQYITSEVDSAVGGDPSFDSFYVQSGYFLTGESRAYKNS
ncbi:MAG: porin, partial [Acidobacteriota bacterium]